MRWAWIAVAGVLALAGCSAAPTTTAGVADSSAPAASTPPPTAPATPLPQPSIPECPAGVAEDVGSTVSAQLAAFSAGDFRSALALASESFRASVDLKGFRQVIRKDYPEVAASVGHRLLECRQADPLRASALVAVTGENGVTAQLGYRFVLEPGGWRVDGASTLAAEPPTTV